MGQTKNVGDQIAYWVRLLRQDKDIREPRVLSRSVIRSCADESEEPPLKNDFIDHLDSDILFLSLPSLSYPLETIMEDSEEDEERKFDEEDKLDPEMGRELLNLVEPPVTRGQEDIPVGLVETVTEETNVFSEKGVEADTPGGSNPLVVTQDSDKD